jgi:hypothetical protein
MPVVPGPIVMSRGKVSAPHGAAMAGQVVIDATNRMGGDEFNSRAAIAAAA